MILNKYHPDTHYFLSQNMPGNDGIAFHSIQEQDESRPIGAESLTMGSFPTHGDTKGEEVVVVLVIGHSGRQGQFCTTDLSNIQCFCCHQYGHYMSDCI